MKFYPEEADNPMGGPPGNEFLGFNLGALPEGLRASGVIVIMRTVYADPERNCKPGLIIQESENLAEWDVNGMMMEAMKLNMTGETYDDADEEEE
jgi:hypothetical protein